MSKQDRVASRTAEDVERKYNFGKTFAEVFGMAEEAQKAAEKAQAAADNANGAVEDLDQDTIFNLLTNNGEIKGLFMQDGQLYINASYLVTGIIKSENGKLVIDLSGETVPTFNTGISTNGLIIRGDIANVDSLVKIEAKQLAENPNEYYVDGRVYSATGNLLMRIVENFSNDYSEAMGITTLMYNQDRSLDLKTTVSHANAGIDFQCNGSTVGSIYCSADGVMHLYINKINGLTVSWKDNGDGTYTLIGQ